MKPIVKKILESGLVAKHTIKMMEHWGWLEPGAVDIAIKADMEKTTTSFLNNLAEDIAELLEDDVKVKETRLDTSVRRSVSFQAPNIVGVIKAEEDHMGHIIVPNHVTLKRGDVLHTVDTDIPVFKVLDIDDLYIGDVVVGHQITVEDLVKR